MGTHRSGTRSRGVSKGPVIAVVAVLLLVAAVFAWFQFRDRAAERDSAAAADCVEGSATVSVTVDPGIEAPVRAIAEKYNATDPQVRDHCVTVTVTAQPSAAVVEAFRAGGPWNSTLGPQPALWIPDSSRSVEAMRVPGLVAGEPSPIAATPVALAVPEPLRAALAQANVAWADLPRLQQGSLDELGLSGWGGLRLALPEGDAALAVATSVAAAVAGEEPLTESGAASGQAVAAVSGLAVGAPDAGDTAAALAAAGGGNAPVHAVAATEQQIAAHPQLAAFRPAGTTPVADHPAALLSGPWVDQTQNLAAGMFVDYLRHPDQAAFFTTAGFTATPAPTGAGADRAALETVRATLANPVLGVHATVLVDVSASMATTEGSTTRLANTLGALRSTMTVMPPDFGLGVWTFGKNLDGNRPYEVQAPTGLLTDAQRAAVDQALSSVRATDTRPDQAYPTLLAAYRQAVQNHQAGRTNTVLLVTDGPDDDSAVTGPQLLADLAAAADPARPVRIDVIVVGGAGTDTLQTAAERTGGTYTTVPTSNDLAFGTAMAQALTTT
ncbi:VWA domain-containing protein [Nocardia farcinica]|nr:VWA domain-containing protein [Nocardia farcinica]MBF6430126.1 VWA domain-containing protein [Nocardia farcinica]MBF6500712.1 VWA domain-containing protein [Nocardia farcinica]